jgi:hypothetical protein
MKRSKSILYVDDPGFACADEYPDNIEAQGIEEAWSPIEEVLSSQGADGGLFAGGDSFEWMPEAGSPAPFHFDEDEGVGTDVQTLELRFRALLAEETSDVHLALGKARAASGPIYLITE